MAETKTKWEVKAAGVGFFAMGGWLVADTVFNDAMLAAPLSIFTVLCLLAFVFEPRG